jgi:DNA uptake protein ComE-like DNA-binding protein
MTRAVGPLLFLFSVLLTRTTIALAQDISPAAQSQLENLTDARQEEPKDDYYLQSLEHFKKHSLNLNTASAADLRELVVLTDLQIDNFIAYRDLLGKLISIYELQAVPAWDIETIHKIVPYVGVGSALSTVEDVRKRLKDGDQNLLIRLSQVLEKSDGFKKTAGSGYVGGRERIFFRYRYQYKSLLQFGIAGDKDAGEQFFKGADKYGFDFYSLHLFARRIGKIQELALGDFTVNMGQGLMQWQSLAFSKSADVINIKRQSPVLRPYSSSGEFYFHRGLGITMKFDKIEATLFGSLRKLSSNFVADTINNEDFISSFQSSGYHRTRAEIDDRNNLRQVAVGGNVSYLGRNWHLGINGIAYHFSLPIVKRAEPYNLFAISGNHWNNFSIDYSYTHHNFHLFGEWAVDKNFSRAFLNGLLISVDPRVDLALVQRAIGKKYQAAYGNAFTENAYPTNENGIYIGTSIRPWTGWRIDMYADFYEFPWLKYLVDAPAYGRDLLVQINFSLGKQLQIYSRLKVEAKQTNQTGNITVTNYLVMIPKQSWRSEINYQINAAVSLRERIEMLSYNKRLNKQNGFLAFFDVLYKPLKPFSGVVRLQYFETNGYDSRIYAYENEVLYNFSIPAFIDKGYRYYINLDYDLKTNLFFWFRWSQTVYPGKKSIGSGLDRIGTNHRSEIELQMQWFF